MPRAKAAAKPAPGAATESVAGPARGSAAGAESVAPAPGATFDPAFGDAVLRAAAIHTACIALSDAAAHLRRTSMLVEAASTAALVRSLQGGPGDNGWVLTLEGAERTMQAAMATFTQTSQAAVGLVNRVPDQAGG